MILAKWEKFLPITIITQNVDELHQRAGSKNITVKYLARLDK